MKLALIGAVAVLAAAFANFAEARTAVDDAAYRTQFYSDTNAQYYPSLLHHASEPDRYRYHGGPKSND
jgi:hypothetical protein